MSARPDAAKYARTAVEASERLGVDQRTFRRWRGSPWFLETFQTSEGWFDVEAIRSARPAGTDEQAGQTTELRRLRVELETAKVREKIAASEMAEMKTREKAGSLIPRQSHELHWSQLLTGLAAEFDQLPSLVAMRVPKKSQDDVRDFLTAELNTIRNRVADKLVAMAKELDTAAAKVAGGRG